MKMTPNITACPLGCGDNRRHDKGDIVDVNPVRHEHWIEEEGSECGEKREWNDHRANYCDTCGAKMDGQGETNE